MSAPTVSLQVIAIGSDPPKLASALLLLEGQRPHLTFPLETAGGRTKRSGREADPPEMPRGLPRGCVTPSRPLREIQLLFLNPRQSLRNRAFTLFEVVLALSIFVVLVGGVYFAVSSAVRASLEMGDAQMQTRTHSSFVRFLRGGFFNLPAEAEISLRTRDQGRAGHTVELILRKAAGAFETGALESIGSGVVLAALPDGRGRSTFSLTRFSDRLSEDELDRYLEKAKWLPVLDQVETLRWRFWDKSLSGFVETWEQPTVRPEWIELTFSTSFERETVCIFRLPSLVRAVPDEPVAPAEPFPNPPK